MFRGIWYNDGLRLSIIPAWILPPISRRQRRIYIHWAWKFMVCERYQSDRKRKQNLEAAGLDRI